MQERYLGPLGEGMDVCDVHGGKVGTIGRIHASPLGGMLPAEDILEVKTGPLGLGRRLYIPRSAVREGTKGCIFLAVPCDDFARLGWDSKPALLHATR